MANWLVGFRIQAQPGKGEELAKMLAQAEKMNIPGNIRFEVGRYEDLVFGTEEWTSQETWDGSLAIPEVQQRIQDALTLVSRGPEIVYTGFKVDPD